MKKLMVLIIAISIAAVSNSQTLQDKWIKCDSSGILILDPYFSEGVTSVWDGDSVDGKANGYGELKKFNNGILESTYIGEYNMGVREGKGTFYHSDGTILEANFVNGQAMGYGVWTDHGNVYNGEIVNYRKHGSGTQHFANGNIFEGIFISGDRYSGTYTYVNGTKEYIEKYRTVTKLQKVKKTNYSPELGVQIKEFFDDNWERCDRSDAKFYRLITYKAQNIPDGIVIDYYITGEKQSVFNPVYIDYNDDNLNFHELKAVWYYESGDVSRKCSYFNNQLNGIDTTFFENGNIKAVTNYNHDKIDGDRTRYYENGGVYSTGAYKMGKLINKYRSYFENGQIYCEMNFKDGMSDGIAKYWGKSGSLAKVSYYTNGELLDGKSIRYFDNGGSSLVHYEDFYFSRKIWEKEDSKSISLVTENDDLRLVNKGKTISTRLNSMPVKKADFYMVSTSLCQVSGSDKSYYGLVYGYADDDNYNIFVIKSSGESKIVTYNNGKETVIKEWTLSTKIKNNSNNELFLIKKQGVYYFHINDDVVFISENVDLYGDKFGVVASGKGEYNISYISTYEDINNDEEIRKRDPNNELNLTGDWKGGGTGFFISNKGYIATNYHVIKDAKEIEVEYTIGNKKYISKAKVEVSDKHNDIAILKIDSANSVNTPQIPYVFKTTTEDVGTAVFALGYPLTKVMGDGVKFTDGKISSKTGFKGDVTTYQISTPLQPGNSGGPLFDYDGNLIGITSASLNREVFNSENVNYAIKISYLQNLIEVLPEDINLPTESLVANKSLTEKIKIISDFVPIIRVK